MRALAAIALAACSGKSAESEPAAVAAGSAAPVQAPAPAPGTVPRSPPRPYRIHWSSVSATDGCFFFSGPEGRDDQLVGEVRVETVELEGSSFRMRIGGALFEGTYAGGSLALVRDSTHEFGGAWKTHETIRGREIDGELRATYRYEECEVASGDCPGRCTIEADIAIRR